MEAQDIARQHMIHEAAKSVSVSGMFPELDAAAASGMVSSRRGPRLAPSPTIMQAAAVQPAAVQPAAPFLAHYALFDQMAGAGSGGGSSRGAASGGGLYRS